MEVQHRPWKQHQNADAMSRLPCNQCGFNDNLETLENFPQVRIATVETLDFPDSNVQKIQCQDKDLDVVKKWLDSEEKPKFRDISSEGVFLRSLWSKLDLLVIRDGLICRKTSRDDTGL
jgi:hypothetical protein